MVTVIFYRQQIKKGKNRLYFGFPLLEQAIAVYHAKYRQEGQQTESQDPPEPSEEGVAVDENNDEKTAKVAFQAGESLLSLETSFNSFLLGMEQMFLNAVLLVLSWTLGAVVEILGANRFFSTLLSGIQVESLPAAVFGISALMSRGLGGGTSAILFPLGKKRKVLPLALGQVPRTGRRLEGHN